MTTSGVADAVPTSASPPEPTTARAVSPDVDTTSDQPGKAVTLRTRVVERNLDIPWDVAVLPSGRWLITERTRNRLLMRRADGRLRVLASPPRVWTSGETGLMSVVADPRVVRNSRFYTCAGWTENGRNDVRVHAWRLNRARNEARIVETLVSGIQATSGRHGGCRLRLDALGRLYIGTGDAAVGTNPQNRRSLNGKVLRVNRHTGNASVGNPFANGRTRATRLIYTYGHRNVQGLALRPGGRMWSVEHGTSRDDEVNLLFGGGNYGWNPVPGYNESRPMTDFSLPGRQFRARWKSGDPTIATSGAVWVRGKKWGRYNGALAVCALGGERLVFMKFNDAGRLRWVVAPPALRGTYGRLRSVVLARNNDLLVTTANGEGGDRIVLVSPRS